MTSNNLVHVPNHYITLLQKTKNYENDYITIFG